MVLLVALFILLLVGLIVLIINAIWASIAKNKLRKLITLASLIALKGMDKA